MGREETSSRHGHSVQWRMAFASPENKHYNGVQLVFPLLVALWGVNLAGLNYCSLFSLSSASSCYGQREVAPILQQTDTPSPSYSLIWEEILQPSLNPNSADFKFIKRETLGQA